MLFVRWILGFILTLSIVLALAVVLLPRWFNPNDYRDDIELQLNKATGREIALDGNLQLSVFSMVRCTHRSRKGQSATRDRRRLYAH